MAPSPAPAALAQGPPQSQSPPPGSQAALQIDLANLNAELAGLKVEADRLGGQLKQATGTAVDILQSRATQVGLDIARVEGDIAQTQARIAATQGRTRPGSAPPSGRDPFDSQPSPIMVTQMVFVLALALIFPLSIAWARRLARGGTRAANASAAEIGPRLDRLEQAVDSIAIEVERISEGQRFVTKLLSEQPQVKASVSAGKSDTKSA